MTKHYWIVYLNAIYAEVHCLCLGAIILNVIIIGKKTYKRGKNMNDNKMLKSMALGFYEEWYQKDVSPNLDEETKLDIVGRISRISLRRPIYLPNVEISLDDFPELKPFTHTVTISGMQLYVVMTEIMKGMGAPVAPASEVALR